MPVPLPYRNPGSSAGGGGNFGGGGGGGNGFGGFTRDTKTNDVSQTLGSIGLYADSIIQLSKRLQLIPGVRFDLFFYQQDQIRPTVDPRLTLRYSWHRRTVLKAAAGLFTNSPPEGLSNAVIGNPNLELEHAVHLSAGIEQGLWPRALSLDAQLLRGCSCWIHRASCRLAFGGAFRCLGWLGKPQPANNSSHLLPIYATISSIISALGGCP